MNRSLQNILKCPYCPDGKDRLAVDPNAWIQTVPRIRLAKALSAGEFLYLDPSISPSEIFVFNRGIGSQHPCRHLVSYWADCEVQHKVGEPDGALDISLNYHHPWLALAESREDIMGCLWESPEQLVRAKTSYPFKRIKRSFSISGFDRELNIVGHFYPAERPVRFLKEIERKLCIRELAGEFDKGCQRHNRSQQCH